MNKWVAEFELEDGDTMPEHMDLEYKGAKLDFHCRPMWIPINEGLPKDESRVEVTLYSPARRRKVVRNGVFNRDMFHLDNGECWNSYDEEILAWKYECELYKAESED